MLRMSTKMLRWEDRVKRRPKVVQGPFVGKEMKVVLALNAPLFKLVKLFQVLNAFHLSQNHESVHSQIVDITMRGETLKWNEKGEEN